MASGNRDLPEELGGNNPYQALAHAIVYRTVEDYRRALTEADAPLSESRRHEAQRMIWECETFFRSEWFEMLCGLDGETIIKRLKEELNGTG